MYTVSCSYVIIITLFVCIHNVYIYIYLCVNVCVFVCICVRVCACVYRYKFVVMKKLFILYKIHLFNYDFA